MLAITAMEGIVTCAAHADDAVIQPGKKKGRLQVPNGLPFPHSWLETQASPATAHGLGQCVRQRPPLGMVCVAAVSVFGTVSGHGIAAGPGTERSRFNVSIPRLDVGLRCCMTATIPHWQQQAHCLTI